MKIKRYEILHKFEKKWIALDKSNSRVLVSGSTIEEVEKRLKKIKEKASAIEYVMPFNSYFSPLCL